MLKMLFSGVHRPFSSKLTYFLYTILKEQGRTKQAFRLYLFKKTHYVAVGQFDLPSVLIWSRS